MLALLRNLVGGARPVASADRLLVGVWSPASGDPKETVEYRSDGTIRLALYGGRAHLHGRYRFLGERLLQIDWDIACQEDEDPLTDYLNDHLAELEGAPQMRLVRQTVLRVEVTPTELRTLQPGKERTGRFRRVA
jgi:hypothetical protein